MCILFEIFNLDFIFHLTGQPKEYDPKFAGPIEKRSCTDVVCLLMLVAFILGWCVIAVIG